MTHVFVVGSDHAGVQLRDALIEDLVARGHTLAGVAGPRDAQTRADYPHVARDAVSRMLAHDRALGLLVCGTGQGMAMTANRVPGVRAAVCADVFSAKMARAHNDANVLCLGARVLGVGLALEILHAFCEATFEGGRHAARVAQIEA